MNFDEFMEKCFSGEIQANPFTLKMLKAFGKEFYKEYIDLIQEQALNESGYKIIIVKENKED